MEGGLATIQGCRGYTQKRKVRKGEKTRDHTESGGEGYMHKRAIKGGGVRDHTESGGRGYT